ncbi:MAG TPA: ABC transporter permease subunit [Clostridia bacterium]|nr:ABC transporter permease subunit [Clostridia bacterium]
MDARATNAKAQRPYDQMSTLRRIGVDILRSPMLYLMLLPVLAYYILFCYKPMYGALIAFMDFVPGKPLMENKWVGLDNFVRFFQDRNFQRLMVNTVRISLTQIVFGFPMPILFALLLNEVRSKKYLRVVQTISYMPHFISLVVVCGMIRQFVNSDGAITQLLVALGLASKRTLSLLTYPKYFLTVYTVSGIWQGMGYGSIIYLAALMNVSPELYEAAKIDGAGRWRQTVHVTIPGILPTVAILLIMRMGNVLNVGYEKILLLYNAQTYSVADVISTFVYRLGLQQFDFSFSTAVGLFNSVINVAILVLFNALSRKFNQNSLW